MDKLNVNERCKLEPNLEDKKDFHSFATMDERSTMMIRSIKQSLSGLFSDAIERGIHAERFGIEWFDPLTQSS